MNLEHIAINVPNVRAAAQWYANNLDMRIVLSANQPPYMHFLADNKGSMMEFYSRTDVAPPDYQSLNPFNLHLAFQVDDIVGKRDALIRAGASLEDDITPTSVGDQLAFLRDPWGVPLQLVKRNKSLE